MDDYLIPEDIETFIRAQQSAEEERERERGWCGDGGDWQNGMETYIVRGI